MMTKELFSRARVRKLLWYVLYLFLTLVAQNMVLTNLRLAGVCPFILPAAAVAVGVFEGSARGAIFGLVMGIFADFAFIESTVGFTLMFPLLGFGAGFIAQFFINRRFLAYMLAAAGGLLTVALLQMLRVTVAEGFALQMLGTVVLQTVWSLPMAAVLYFPPERLSEYE